MTAKKERSASYETARKYYAAGLWGEERLKELVKRGKLSDDELKEIVREG